MTVNPYKIVCMTVVGMNDLHIFDAGGAAQPGITSDSEGNLVEYRSCMFSPVSARDARAHAAKLAQTIECAKRLRGNMYHTRSNNMAGGKMLNPTRYRV